MLEKLPAVATLFSNKVFIVFIGSFRLLNKGFKGLSPPVVPQSRFASLRPYKLRSSRSQPLQKKHSATLRIFFYKCLRAFLYCALRVAGGYSAPLRS